MVATVAREGRSCSHACPMVIGCRLTRLLSSCRHRSKSNWLSVLKGRSFWNGHQKVSATKPTTVFDLTFLPTGTRRTEMGLKQIMSAEGNKGAIFHPLSSLCPFCQGQFHGCCQVVIANASRHTAKVVETLAHGIQESFLAFATETSSQTFVVNSTSRMTKYCTVCRTPPMMAMASPQSHCASWPGSNLRGERALGLMVCSFPFAPMYCRIRDSDPS